MKRFLILLLVASACTSQSGDTTTTAPATTAATTTTSPGSSTSAVGSTTPDPTTTTTSVTPTTSPVPTPPLPTTVPTTVPATTIADGNTAPSVTITGPGNLTRHVAKFDSDLNWFVADVALSAVFADADGDAVTIEWFSDVGGSLGSGASITAALLPLSDSTIHEITAKATDAKGASTTTTITIIVWIPSS